MMYFSALWLVSWIHFLYPSAKLTVAMTVFLNKSGNYKTNIVKLTLVLATPHFTQERILQLMHVNELI